MKTIKQLLLLITVFTSYGLQVTAMKRSENPMKADTQVKRAKSDPTGFVAEAKKPTQEKEDAKESKKADSSCLNFKAIKERLAKIDFGGCHFSLCKKRTVKIKHEKITKSIELWFTDLEKKTSFIGEITYLIPTKQKNDAGQSNGIEIDLIEIQFEVYKKIGLGAIMAIVALLDAVKTAPFCKYAYVRAENEKSIGLFKHVIKFEKSKPQEVGERLSTEQLPTIVSNLSEPLEKAFTKLAKAAKNTFPD